MSAVSCDRVCLEGFVNQYLDAMVARNPYSLPLAPKVRFTENEQVIPLGEGIWGTASGLGTYELFVADPQNGQVGFLGTLRENDTPIAIAIRLKIEARLIGEVETIVVRDAGAAKAIEALGAPDPSHLPVTPTVKFTENDVALKLGDGLWGTANARGTYKEYFDDPEEGQVAFFGSLKENGHGIALACA